MQLSSTSEKQKPEDCRGTRGLTFTFILLNFIMSFTLL